MDIVSLLIYRAMSGSGGQTPVATDVSYDNTTSGLLADNVQNAIDELSSEKINTSEKGTANGVAELNENGIVLTSQLPSFVDDVLEFPTLNDFPAQGESGKIYVDLSTNKTYRWGGSSYTEISPSLALGETSSTAYRGDRGKAAYDHSQLKTGNPHNVTKAQIGLGNVDNTSDLNKPISTATQSALDTKLSEDDLYNMTEDSTVSGNPVTLKTLAKTSAKSCSVTMNPIQDLHGQSAPYPAGGGKNLLPITVENIKASNSNYTWVGNETTVNGVKWTILTDDDENVIGIKANGTASSNSFINMCSKNVKPFLTDGTQYIVNGCPTNGSNSRYGISISDNITATYHDYGSGYTFTVPSGMQSNNHFCRTIVFAGYNAENIIFYPMLRLPTVTDATFAPYSNICPISGRDSLHLYQDTEQTETPETTHTATFPSTVYGGSHEFVSGKAKSEWLMKDLGDYNYSYDSSFDIFVTTEILGYENGTPFISSQYKDAGAVSVSVLNNNECTLRVGALYIKNTDYTDAALFKNAMTGVQFCHKTNTPTEITLTAEQVALLKGNNTLWTDGDNMEIIYTELDLTELPDVTSADEGKVLTVNSSGEWVASTLPDGTNISY